MADSLLAAAPADARSVIDSLRERMGVAEVTREGEVTVARLGGLRLTFDRHGLLAVDTLSAESARTDSLRPYLGARGVDEFVPADSAVWREVARFTGEGIYEYTDAFRVRSREWRVIATGRTAPGYSSRRLEPRRIGGGGDLGSLRVEPPGEDTTYVHHGPGFYQLVLFYFATPWTVRVEEKRVRAPSEPRTESAPPTR